ncbi:hypothetical protein G7K_4817-t1 [Saitoella complicata NRRL Y-17804]|uniref:Uncharacterized protein n=1 Tax=Saitoella complicata (strain BCRC 22490 / CBS 7301 / JCM 7358 / NBRC 10748 / NRRL Y-17804) TaxID=698492 RepID=A0A0E9NLX7_SAICN|nr:hypothetical protein G7K_4817-t1 [Saitoella complicata NRRL Y-17804]
MRLYELCHLTNELPDVAISAARTEPPQTSENVHAAIKNDLLFLGPQRSNPYRIANANDNRPHVQCSSSRR